MAKLWPSLSILLVLAMLLFLAPAMILAPPQNVSAAGEDVVQEVEATFCFTETDPGDWWTFTAGGGGIESPGLCLEQYTRPYVDRGMTGELPGCGFRNYTTGSGSVSGDLVGIMDLAWNTFRFNQTYPGDLYYPSATDFGFMAGRGHFYATDPSDNFTFVFVLDFDSDETITNAVGKGFMVSVEENGAFAGHKVIGDFDVSKSGADYTWNLHLRNYAPNEVHYKGNVLVDGGVMQEVTDPIHNGLELVNFTSDNPMSTPTNLATGFEEIAWGKDPFKNITGGPLGIGGLMDITRNGALYLALPGGHVQIQAAEACMLHIDDTIAQTGESNSTYGHTYYYLVLALPYQDLVLGEMFKQDGYTWYPFGMYLDPTDWYAGAETFALAHIDIESAAGEAHQVSVDESYGLYPHPKIESVSPDHGMPNTTMDVTITGKYFLRAVGEKSGWVPNSGSLDFGDGITVNSYTINNATDPIDNSITANINISSGAAIGKRNVTVTSCFGYSNGNGTDPYKTGALVDGFEVSGAAATLEGNVSFTGRGSAPDPKWIEPFTVKGFLPGTTNVVWSGTATTNDTGVFTMTGISPDTYDIGIKNCTCLSELVTGVTLTEGVTTQVNFCNSNIREGDVNDNDVINILDASAFVGAWLTSVGDPNYDPNSDFNRDGNINILDASALASNFLAQGDVYPNW